MPSGHVVDLCAHKPEAIDIRDIASALAKLCRFTGATASFYSVAQHSVVVARFLPDRLKPYGLLHDAHEAYLGDIATPVKHLIGVEFFKTVELALDRAIFAKAKLPWPLCADDARTLKAADIAAFVLERHDLILNGERYLPPDLRMARPAAPHLKPLDWRAAEDLYIDALARALPDLF